MHRIKKGIFAVSMSVVVGAMGISMVVPANVSAAAITSGSSASDCSQRFLTFPTWFRGLVEVKQTIAPVDSTATTKSVPGVYECVIKSPDNVGGIGPFITRILLNVVEIGLQGVAYLTAAFILWGGFQFMISQGVPDAIAKARKTILDAVIGFGISIGAIAIINLIFGIIK